MPAPVTKKISKKKIANTSMEAKTPSKTVIVLEEYLEFGSWMNKPLTNGYLERLATEFVNWAKNDPEALRAGDFFLNNNIPERYMHKWKEKYPIMEEAISIVKAFIASRREKGALKREYDSGTVRFMQPHYDEDWKKTEEWRAALNEKDENQKDIRVIIERFPSIASVPVKNIEAPE